MKTEEKNEGILTAATVAVGSIVGVAISLVARDTKTETERLAMDAERRLIDLIRVVVREELKAQ